jgi:hypothetical protein
MPDNISNCGELIAPPARMTSRSARAILVSPCLTYSMPTARVPSNTTRVASAPTSIVRLGRFSAGRRYAVAALQRRPSRMVIWIAANPSCSAPL